MLNSNSSLPPQPWDYRIPQTTMTVRFSDYGPRLLDIDVAFCLLDAANLVMTHWGDFDPIGPTILVTSSGATKLQLVSTNDINWYQWGIAIGGIEHFLEMYEPVCMDFSIRLPRKGVIAGGTLSLGVSNHT